MKTTDNILLIAIDKIDESPYQGRFLDFTQDLTAQFADTGKDIEELAKSISKSGLLQPILLRPIEGSDMYELIDGHRRLMAYRYLGRNAIEAIVRPMTDKEAQVQSIIGNLQRKNLTKIELATAYQKVLDSGLFATAKELSVSLGKDETFVSDTLNLLKLDQMIIDDLGKNNTIKDVRLLRQIRKISPVDENGRSEAQYELYRKVVDEKLSRDDVKQYIQSTTRKEQEEVPFYKISNKGRRMYVELNSKLLSPDKREILERILRDKMKEVEALFGK